MVSSPRRGTAACVRAPEHPSLNSGSQERGLEPNSGLGPGSRRFLGGTGLFPALISVQAADRGAMGDHRPRIQADGLSLSSLPSVTATLLWRTGSMDSTSSRLDALWRVLAVLQLARARGLHRRAIAVFERPLRACNSRVRGDCTR